MEANHSTSRGPCAAASGRSKFPPYGQSKHFEYIAIEFLGPSVAELQKDGAGVIEETVITVLETRRPPDPPSVALNTKPCGSLRMGNTSDEEACEFTEAPFPTIALP